MKKYQLLLYEIISRSVRLKLLILAFILFLAAIYDMLNPFLGDFWYLAWLAFAITFGLWFYYGFLMKRASIRLYPKYLRLQGPLYGINFSYARIQAVKSVTMSREWPLEKLGFFDRSRLRPLYGDTAVFVALSSVPKAYRRRHIWFRGSRSASRRRMSRAAR